MDERRAEVGGEWCKGLGQLSGWPGWVGERVAVLWLAGPVVKIR